MAIEQDGDDIRLLAREARGIIRASGHFDPTARVYALINALEATAISLHHEAMDNSRSEEQK